MMLPGRIIERVKRLPLRTILMVAAGAGLGYAYYAFIGCRTGACPITSNPLISAAYGGVLGGLLSRSIKRP